MSFDYRGFLCLDVKSVIKSPTSIPKGSVVGYLSIEKLFHNMLQKRQLNCIINTRGVFRPVQYINVIRYYK